MDINDGLAGTLAWFSIPLGIAVLIFSFPMLFLILAAGASFLVGGLVVAGSVLAGPRLLGGIAELEGLLLLCAGVVFAGMAGGISTLRHELRRSPPRDDSLPNGGRDARPPRDF